MRPAITKFAKPHPVIFKTVPPKPVANPKAATPGAKSQKRDNIFSKSRDTREDRSARQMKSSRNPQTFSHGR
jgi:hypothetical protein